MIGVSISTLSLAPGFDKQKRELLELLNRAVTLSEMLHVEIDDKAYAPQLSCISKQLAEMIAHQRDR